MAIIGIDLGTTNSSCAYWNGDQVEIIPNRFNEYLTPSVVGIDETGELIVGKYASARLLVDPASCTATFKRYMGSKYKAKLGNSTYSATELSAMILKSLKTDAEAFLDAPVTESIISVPAYFNDIQRKATKAAAELVGLKVERLINEPTAAALAYGLHEKPEDAKFIVLDLGGGTFDVSLMEYFDGVLEVHATAGDNYLGGEDFLQVMVEIYLGKSGHDIEHLSSRDIRKLYSSMELAKRALSNERAVKIPGFLAEDDADIEISRDEFGHACQHLLARVQVPIERTLRDSGVSPNELNEVILVGGATRMQIFRSMITRLFQRMPTIHLDPDLIVTRGTAIQAGLKEKNQALDDVVLTDVCSYSLGTGIVNDNDKRQDMGSLFSPIIERNCVVPISIEKRYYTSYDNQSEVLFDIYQGESRLVKNNVKLGEITVKVPRAPEGEEAVDVRFSYDMNGLLEVDVTVISTGLKKSLQIQNSDCQLSDLELAAASARLATLKFHPQELEINKELLARAERLFESSLDEQRAAISRLISHFESELATQIPSRIEEAGKIFKRHLAGYEADRLF